MKFILKLGKKIYNFFAVIIVAGVFLLVLGGFTFGISFGVSQVSKVVSYFDDKKGDSNPNPTYEEIQERKQRNLEDSYEVIPYPDYDNNDPGYHQVDGYYRSDGTYVDSYIRSNPDGDPTNNINN